MRRPTSKHQDKHFKLSPPIIDFRNYPDVILHSKLLNVHEYFAKHARMNVLFQTTHSLKRCRTQRWSLNLFCEIRSSRFSTFQIQISIFQARFLKREIFFNLSLWLLIFHFQAAILEITLCHLFSKFWWFRLRWLHFDCRSLIFGHQTWKSLNSQTTSSFQKSNFNSNCTNQISKLEA